VKDSRAAKRYARALFQASLKENLVAQVDEDMASLSAAIHASKALRGFLLDPTINTAEKIAFIDRSLGTQIHPLSLGLIKLAVSKGREGDLVAIQLELAELRRQHEQVVHAVIESAEELPQDQKDKVVAKVSQMTGRRVEAEYKTDSSLIGGVKVSYDNLVLDGTTKGHLSRMKDALLRDALKQA
jgi:F-type H+-transporting ATPase subunit delta